MINLSKRLQTIAGQVLPGQRVADIGSDHALLPVYLVQKGVAPAVIAGEVNQGPYQAAVQQVKAAGLSARIEVRKGNGLAVLEPGEADAITIAGMGGSLIVSILTEGLNKLEGVSRLILQPNVGEEAVRRFLVEQGWKLEAEQILEEDGKIYEILTAGRTPVPLEENEKLYKPRSVRGVSLSAERLLAMGPYLIEEGSAVFERKWLMEVEKLGKISRQLEGSELDASRLKRDLLQKEVAEIKEVIRCLPRDKR
ncbi:class I SAM-dependent methyltransferase [Paenibacillus aurantius]|uniref:Class I SAM-dependent methyltransferase n=1 Tax=Paenibacillus aurantius TaxID=2918900 RepID=A0AA96LJX9_9BACL|nr:class I SAM-dependent methyltransferase [Paenibacillus aurantius]WNQ13475.1 class I SAM-dependent methyltransferase [Paenibacillus aurantius]